MFRLRTFGGAALYNDGRPLDGPAVQRRRLALLALLAVAGSAGLSRDKLLAILWPETDTDRARHTLSQWLHLLRRDLGAADVILGSADLRLNPERLASDAHDFERAVAVGNLEAAFELYAGHFLDGFHLTDSPEFERWVDGERERLDASWRRAAELLADRRAGQGDAVGELTVWRRLAAADPFEKRYVLALMRALAAGDDVPAALAHARVYEKLLEQEFGEALPTEVRTLAGSLEASVARKRASHEARHDASPDADAPSALPAQQPIAAAARDAAATPPIAIAAPRRVPGRRVVLLAVSLLVTALIALYGLVPRQVRATALTVMSRRPERLDPRRIVVAPLTNDTGDSSLAVFGDMAADWTAQALMRTGEVEVVDARSAIITSRIVDMLPRLLRPSNKAIALAEELGAGQVVEGRFYVDADTLLVQVQLIDAATRRVLHIVGPLTGSVRQPALLVQVLGDQVAAAAAARVDSSYAARGVVLSAPPSFEAYRETSRAWEAYYRSDMPGLVAHVARARAADSGYMLPLVMLGHVYSEQREWRRVDSVARIVAAHRARLTPVELAGLELLEALAAGDADAALRAGLDLQHAAPRSAETQTHAAHLAVEANMPRTALRVLAPVDPTRGLLLVVPWYWNWKAAALHELGDYEGQKRVVELGLRQFPDNAGLLLQLGKALSALGRLDQVQQLAERAPSAPTSRALRLAVLQRHAMQLDWSRELSAHGHRREGAALTARVLADLEQSRADTSRRGLLVHAMALEQAGRWAEARSLFAALAARDPMDVTTRGHLAVADGRLGFHDEAERIARELEERRDPYLHGQPTIWRARIAAALGHRAESAALVVRAVEEGYIRGYDLYGSSFGEYDLHSDPLLDTVRPLLVIQQLLAPRG